MVKRGYTLESIELMDCARYDYIARIILEEKKSGKGNPFEGGL